MFTGREYDAETGLYFYRARYYSPELGRFLQTDPLEIDDENTYTYCYNDSVNHIDPYGYQGIGYLEYADQGYGYQATRTIFEPKIWLGGSGGGAYLGGRTPPIAGGSGIPIGGVWSPPLPGDNVAPNPKILSHVDTQPQDISEKITHWATQGEQGDKKKDTNGDNQKDPDWWKKFKELLKRLLWDEKRKKWVDDKWVYYFDKNPHKNRGGAPHVDRGPIEGGKGSGEWSPDGINWYPK